MKVNSSASLVPLVAVRLHFWILLVQLTSHLRVTCTFAVSESRAALRTSFLLLLDSTSLVSCSKLSTWLDLWLHLKMLSYLCSFTVNYPAKKSAREPYNFSPMSVSKIVWIISPTSSPVVSNNVSLLQDLFLITHQFCYLMSLLVIWTHVVLISWWKSSSTSTKRRVLLWSWLLTMSDWRHLLIELSVWLMVKSARFNMLTWKPVPNCKHNLTREWLRFNLDRSRTSSLFVRVSRRPTMPSKTLTMATCLLTKCHKTTSSCWKMVHQRHL